jgi:hypothetical protein
MGDRATFTPGIFIWSCDRQRQEPANGVLIDGQPPSLPKGVDVDDQGNGTVTEQRLYQLIRQPKPIANRQFEITFLDPGVQVYAFTFG